MGKRALIVEGTLATIMDMLCCTDIPSALSIITTINGDQATMSQLKEELEKEKKLNSELIDTPSKFEDNRRNQLRINAEIQLVMTDRQKSLQKDTDSWKVHLVEEKRRVNEWAPQVYLIISKLKYPLQMCEEHIKTCSNFTLHWKEYCDKYKPSNSKGDAE